MIGIKSDVGNLGNLNKDYTEFYENEDLEIYIVVDGMGGHNAGEIASKTASKSLIKYIKDNFKNINNTEILRKTTRHANSEVSNLAHCNEAYSGMGTTLVACLITKNIIQVANVGDSSCYGVEFSKVTKITKDHSLVQELLDCGSISKEQAINHPQKNVITRAIGTGGMVDIDVFGIRKDKFEFFLICSDGLSNEIDIEEVLSFGIEEKYLQNICEKLADKAKTNGGRDDITVMLLEGEV